MKWRIPTPDEIMNYGMSLLPWAGIIAGFMFITAVCKNGCMHVLFN